MIIPVEVDAEELFPTRKTDEPSKPLSYDDSLLHSTTSSHLSRPSCRDSYTSGHFSICAREAEKEVSSQENTSKKSSCAKRFLFKLKRTTRKFLAFCYANADLALLYLSYGLLLGFPMSSMTLFLNNDLGLAARPDLISYYYSMTFLMFTLKFLWAGFSDAVPIFGDRRRPYLILSSAISSLCYILMATKVKSMSLLYPIGMLNSFAEAFYITVVDGVAIERTGNCRSRTADFQSFIRFMQNFATLIATALSTLSLAFLSVRCTLGLTAVFPLLACISTLLVKPTKDAKSMEFCLACWKFTSQADNRCKTFFTELFLLSKHFFVPGLYLFVRGILPDSNMAERSWMATLALPNWLFSTLSFVTPLANQLGVILYWMICHKRNLKLVIVGTTLFSAFVNLCDIIPVQGWNRAIGIPDCVFLFIKEFVGGLEARFVYMPLFVLASLLSPMSLAAFTFASFFSFENLAYLIQGPVNAAVINAFHVSADTQWSSLWKFILLASCLRPLPLLFLPFMSLTPPASHVAFLEEEGRGSDREHQIDRRSSSGNESRDIISAVSRAD